MAASSTSSSIDVNQDLNNEPENIIGENDDVVDVHNLNFEDIIQEDDHNIDEQGGEKFDFMAEHRRIQDDDEHDDEDVDEEDDDEHDDEDVDDEDGDDEDGGDEDGGGNDGCDGGGFNHQPQDVDDEDGGGNDGCDGGGFIHQPQDDDEHDNEDIDDEDDNDEDVDDEDGGGNDGCDGGGFNHQPQGSQQNPLLAPINIDNREKNMDYYVPLCRAIIMGDWEKAQEFINKDRDALTNQINLHGATTLHVAIGNPQNNFILEKLLLQINPESLPSLVNNHAQNPLHRAAILDNTIAAEMLVEKNPHLLFTVDEDNSLPIERAIYNFHNTTFRYLLQACKKHIGLSQKDGYRYPFEGENGAEILLHTILGGFLDIAYDILKEYPVLATTIGSGGEAALFYIAKMRDSYPSAKQYNFYQRFVYSHVSAENHSLDDTYKIYDIENQKSYKAKLVTKSYSAIKKIFGNPWKSALLHVPHIKHLHEDKVKHNLALAILRFISEKVSNLESNHFEHYGNAFIIAVKNNTPEVIENLIQLFPHSIWTSTDNDYYLSQLSIMYRCENVYNFLIHEVTQEKCLYNRFKDDDKNNLLHLAGQLAPIEKLNMVTGAALQMQRELQWFQEVSKYILPTDRENRNIKNETPIMVFRKEHKELRKEGEEWMKKTADAYTITAALIITIVFAAAITVPGGNNDTGKAIYETRPSFIIFAISDAISLFTSTTSLLLFLSILTARYAEEDFLYKLPKRLILGLVMLFISVTTMMIAFSATLYIMFGQGKSWILIPIAAMTCLPVASFVTLQLPLLVDLIFSTYGRGIFGKQSKFWKTS